MPYLQLAGVMFLLAVVVIGAALLYHWIRPARPEDQENPGGHWTDSAQTKASMADTRPVVERADPDRQIKGIVHDRKDDHA